MALLQEEICGGTWAFSLYKLPWPAAPTADDEYLACYRDTRDERVMTDKITLGHMTPAICREHCSKNEALYYATQVTGGGGGICASRSRGQERMLFYRQVLCFYFLRLSVVLFTGITLCITPTLPAPPWFLCACRARKIVTLDQYKIAVESYGYRSECVPPQTLTSVGAAVSATGGTEDPTTHRRVKWVVARLLARS